MTPAQFPSQVAQRIKALLDVAQSDLLGDSSQIFYGDQNRFGVTPTVCIESGTVTRNLAGVPSRTENILTAYILLYWSKVDSNQQTKLDSEQCAEAIARYLDGNLTLELDGDGGIVIHGFVSTIEPGYSIKGQSGMYYSVRLTWTGKTKTILGA